MKLKNNQKTAFFFLSFANMMMAMGAGRFLFSLMPSFYYTQYVFSYIQIGILGSSIVTGYMLFSLFGSDILYISGERASLSCALSTLFISFLAYFFLRKFSLLLVFGLLMGAAANAVYVLTFPLIYRFTQKDNYGRSIGIILGGAGFGVASITVINMGLNNQDTSQTNSIWAISAIFTLLLLIFNYLFLKNKNVALILKERIQFDGKKIWANILYKNKELVFLNLAYFLFGYAYASYSNYIIAYVRDQINDSFALISWALWGVTTCIGSYIWGYLFDKNTNGNVLIYNYGLMAISFLLATLFKQNFLILTSVIFFGFCFYGYINIFGSLVTHLMKKDAGLYIGKLTFFHALGQIIGILVGGVMRDMTGNFLNIFLLSFIILLFSAIFYVIFLRFKNIKKGILCYQ